MTQVDPWTSAVKLSNFAAAFLYIISKLPHSTPTGKVSCPIYIPGANHILAQPLKRCSASRIKPKETFELAKKKQNILCFGVCEVCGCVGEKNLFTLSPSYVQSPKNREKSLYPTVLQLRWVISTWRDENITLFVFSACYEIHWNWFCERKQTTNAKIRKGAFVFAKSAFIGKSVFQTQRMKAVHGWCSSSDVLRDIPSKFTRSVRRRIVL